MPKHGGWENWETWQMAMILDQRQDFDEWLSGRSSRTTSPQRMLPA